MLNLWQKNQVFPPEVIQPIFDLADPESATSRAIEQQILAKEQQLQQQAPAAVAAAPAASTPSAAAVQPAAGDPPAPPAARQVTADSGRNGPCTGQTGRGLMDRRVSMALTSGRVCMMLRSGLMWWSVQFIKLPHRR